MIDQWIDRGELLCGVSSIDSKGMDGSRQEDAVNARRLGNCRRYLEDELIVSYRQKSTDVVVLCCSVPCCAAMVVAE